MKNMKKIFYGALFALTQIHGPLMAMAARPNTDPNAPQPPAWASFVPMAVLGIAFYFFLLRPQSQQRKEKQNLLDNLKKGDRIVTLGGLIAQVSNITGNIVEIKLNEETKVKLQKSAVVEILVDQPEIPTVVNGVQ